MKRTVLIVAAVLLMVAVLLAWSPWLGRQEAERRAAGAFTAAWEGVADGCGFNCTGCGVAGSRRLAVGYAVTLEYDCGMKSIDQPQNHRRETAYVSPFGTVHGLRRP